MQTKPGDPHHPGQPLRAQTRQVAAFLEQHPNVKLHLTSTYPREVHCQRSLHVHEGFGTQSSSSLHPGLLRRCQAVNDGRTRMPRGELHAKELTATGHWRTPCGWTTRPF